MHTYTLSQEDLFTTLIYDFSTNPKKVKSRKRSVWILFGSFAILSMLAYYAGEIWVSTGSPIQLNIENNSIHIIDKVGDANFKFSQILMVNEITHYFIIKLSNGHVLGVPKINDNLKSAIKKMISEHNLPYQVHLDWKW